jgi:uncharacterized protein (TIGR02996 family)
MTTEYDFQKALDENPEDWQTRLVFADWLQDRDDPRAEGYRALGTSRLAPRRCALHWVWGRDDNDTVPLCHRRALLPLQWFRRCNTSGEWWAYYRTRRGADDAAARAFCV